LPEEYAAKAVVLEGVPDIRWIGGEVPPWTEDWLAEDRSRVKALFPATFGRPHTYLAISGGGSNGAFAAGLLCGWTEAGNRPEFTFVTGVSTGALIAPFAFLGPEYDDELRDAYTTMTSEDIFKKRSKLSALTSDAAASSEPLQRNIAELIDEELMEKIAAEHRRGRRLLVGTAHLDAGRGIVWSIGAIADSGHPDALDLIRQVLLASASIPAAFPPVLIEVEVDGRRYDEMHVDGGTVAQVFLYPMAMDWRDVLQKLEVPGRPRAYVIRNARLAADWETTKNRTLPIAGRAVSSLIRSQGFGDLYRIYVKTQRDGIDFRFAAIPDDFEDTSTEAFDPVYMAALFDLAYQMAKDGYPWYTKPPGYDSTAPDFGEAPK